MYTHHEASFNPDSDFDLVANGIQNVWICQLGSGATDGSFDQFKDNLLQSKVSQWSSLVFQGISLYTMYILCYLI